MPTCSGVGLDVNSMIVAAIGVGVGIDYGHFILLFSGAICEEWQGRQPAIISAAAVVDGDLRQHFRTTGKGQSCSPPASWRLRHPCPGICSLGP